MIINPWYKSSRKITSYDIIHNIYSHEYNIDGYGLTINRYTNTKNDIICFNNLNIELSAYDNNIINRIRFRIHRKIIS